MLSRAAFSRVGAAATARGAAAAAEASGGCRAAAATQASRGCRAARAAAAAAASSLHIIRGSCEVIRAH